MLIACMLSKNTMSACRHFLKTMYTKKLIILSLIAGSIASHSLAQTDVDALRYSTGAIAGTSRFISMSGAFGALGGDFTTLSYNPAGIAIYRSSEFTFTPSVFVGTTKSNFQGNVFDEGKSNFNFGNAGMVFTSRVSGNDNSPGWKSWNFGFGYNRLNNFHNRSFYEGRNLSNSMLDNFAENATGTDPDFLNPFYENLAYNSYMINPDSNNIYASVVPDGQVIQRRFSETRGSMGETVFSFGGNYSNRLYLGATIGIKSLRYEEISTYEEFDPDTAVPYFDRMIFDQNFMTHGSGFDFKFGMIFKANDVLRLGAAFESPTWYAMHDDYRNYMTGFLDTGSVRSFSSASPDGFVDYDLTTPFKFTGSAALVLGNYGLVSADYEYKDAGDANFYGGGTSFSEVNGLISRKYNETHTVRIGTEWIYQSFSFRGGTSFSSSPFTDAYKAGDFDFSQNTYSGGIGYREKNLFIDLGYCYTSSKQYFQPYTLIAEPVPGVKTEIVQSNITLTFGMKF